MEEQTETEEEKLLRLKAGYGQHTSPHRNPPVFGEPLSKLLAPKNSVFAQQATCQTRISQENLTKHFPELVKVS